MSIDDRTPTNEQDSADQLRVDDLAAKEMDPKAAEQVRGGAGTTGKVPISEIQISKHTDVSSAG